MYLFLVLAFSFILTWGIGLSIPLVLRFLILKRPIGKVPAIIISVVVLIINLIIFTILRESQGDPNDTRPHAVQALIAIVSYSILRKSKGIKNTQEAEIPQPEKNPKTKAKLVSKKALIISIVVFLIVAVGALGFVYKDNLRFVASKEENYFDKKVECSNYKDKLETEIGKEQQSIDPDKEMFILKLVTVFYSPKLDSCVYVKSMLVKAEEVKEDEFYLTVYDALTNQEIKSIKTSVFTFIENDVQEYNQFLEEYQAK